MNSIRYILTTITFMMLSINVANAACEYTHAGTPNNLIRNYFYEMKNEYELLYPECSTITCFRFHYDPDGCLRGVYFVPVSAAQNPQVFHIRTIYGEFDHLNFFYFDGELFMYGVFSAFIPLCLGYLGASLKFIITSR